MAVLSKRIIVDFFKGHTVSNKLSSDFILHTFNLKVEREFYLLDSSRTHLIFNYLGFKLYKNYCLCAIYCLLKRDKSMCRNRRHKSIYKHLFLFKCQLQNHPFSSSSHIVRNHDYFWFLPVTFVIFLNSKDQAANTLACT